MLICQITDLHIKADGRKAYGVVDTVAALRACVASIGQLPQAPDVVVVTGDLVDLGRPAEYETLADLLAPLPAPVYLLAGNHDERVALGAAFATHAYLPRGGARLNYVVDEFELRLIALDTTIPGESRGIVDAGTLDWLARTLGEGAGRPTLLMMHHPPFMTGIGHMDEIGLEGIDALRPIVADHPEIERIICGHLHRAISTRFAGTIASTCPSPAHQVVLDLDAGAASAFVMEPPGYQLHLWHADAGLVTHTAAIGHYPGPYPFHDEHGLID